MAFADIVANILGVSSDPLQWSALAQGFSDPRITNPFGASAGIYQRMLAEQQERERQRALEEQRLAWEQARQEREAERFRMAQEKALADEEYRQAQARIASANVQSQQAGLAAQMADVDPYLIQQGMESGAGWEGILKADAEQQAMQQKMLEEQQRRELEQRAGLMPGYLDLPQAGQNALNRREADANRPAPSQAVRVKVGSDGSTAEVTTEQYSMMHALGGVNSFGVVNPTTFAQVVGTAPLEPSGRVSLVDSTARGPGGEPQAGRAEVGTSPELTSLAAEIDGLGVPEGELEEALDYLTRRKGVLLTKSQKAQVLEMLRSR